MIVIAPLGVTSASPWIIAPPPDSSWEIDEVEPTPAAPEPTPAAQAPVMPPPAMPPPPSAEEVELRERIRKDERLAIGGYVLAGFGVVLALASLAPFISGRVEERKQSNFLQEGGDPEAARARKRFGIGGMLIGLGIAGGGGAMIGVGLSRKKRHERELQELKTGPQLTSIAPWIGVDTQGIAVQGRF